MLVVKIVRVVLRIVYRKKRGKITTFPFDELSQGRISTKVPSNCPVLYNTYLGTRKDYVRLAPLHYAPVPRAPTCAVRLHGQSAWSKAGPGETGMERVLRRLTGPHQPTVRERHRHRLGTRRHVKPVQKPQLSTTAAARHGRYIQGNGGRSVSATWEHYFGIDTKIAPSVRPRHGAIRIKMLHRHPPKTKVCHK